jgi:hypothetical protein
MEFELIKKDLQNSNDVFVKQKFWDFDAYYPSSNWDIELRDMNGNLLQQMTGNEKIVSIYLYGGLAGAVFFIVTNNILPGLNINTQNASLIGSNAAVMAVAVATTYLDPNFRFFSHIRKGMPLWILLVLYIIIDFFGISSMNLSVVAAHIGGGIAGFLFVFFLKKGMDGSIWMNQFYHWITNVFTPAKKATKEEIRNKYFYNTGDRKPFSRNANFNQQTIDQILDKINDQGYQSLSEDEKEILKKASEENTEDTDN